MADIRHIDASPRQTRQRNEGNGRRERSFELENQVRGLLADIRIAVVFGGDKRVDGAVLQRTMNPRPWKSYKTVAEDIGGALLRLGAREVCLLPDDMMLGQQLQRHGVQLAWLNTAGAQGYHSASHAAAMLEMFGVPYVGHDPLTAATLDNKHAFKWVLRSLGIATAPSVIWDPSRPSQLDDFVDRARETLGDGPYVVKPVTGRASLHVHFVETPDELRETARSVYELTENLVLVEGFLPGREYCVTVCGRTMALDGQLHEHRQPFTFSVVERTLTSTERVFTSMDKRPINAERFRLLEPKRDLAQVSQLSAMARKIYDELSLQSIIRLDVRADADERLHVLEVNPKPDLRAPAESVTSLACAGLSQIGMSYDDLILSLLADRLNFLIHQRPASVPQLMQLLGAAREPMTGFASP